jgi:hypothetical protein
MTFQVSWMLHPYAVLRSCGSLNGIDGGGIDLSQQGNWHRRCPLPDTPLAVKVPVLLKGFRFRCR